MAQSEQANNWVVKSGEKEAGDAKKWGWPEEQDKQELDYAGVMIQNKIKFFE